jgi:hypothetical protein
MIEYYISLNPDYGNVSFLIYECKFCQTDKMYQYLEISKNKLLNL